ncbi:MAG: aldehyde dehydrogenase family protein [Flavobacteriaceae bacterium]|nr:aldehyde dehydrogenase family protein [Flavobacteriaceae bacterium]
MQELINRQRAFFNSNETKNIDFRIQALKKLKKILEEITKLMDEAIYADFKKSSFDNFTTELALIFHDLNEAIGKVKKWAKVKSVSTNLMNMPAKSYLIPEPLGVSLVIGAWNYPYQLSLAPAIAAIAAGNTVILKPSELPANTSRVLAKMINTNFDPAFFTVVEGGIKETTELLEQKFDKIFFTGSVPVGKIVYQAAAKHLTPVTLELGGKSPAFITESCNLAISTKRLVWSKFLNAGQTCIAPDYVLVHESVKNDFLQLVKKEIESSQFAFENDNYVQIISEKNMHRLAQMIPKEKVYLGGNYDVAKRYFEPTVLTDVSFEDKVMEEEIFGPILPVITYTKLDEAIALVKKGSKPLSCYVYTSDKEIRKKILHEISFGGWLCK